MADGFFKKWFGTDASKTDPSIIKYGEPIALTKYDVQSLLNLNSVVYLQTQLAFPTEDVYVQFPDSKEDEDMIFEFVDTKGIIYGKYKYIRTKAESIDYDKLIEFYSKEWLSNIVSKVVHKTYVDGREAFIVTGKIKDKTFDYFSLVVIEGSNLTIFTLVTNENFLFLNPDYAYKIFASYKFIRDKNVSKRTLKDFICYSADDKKWNYLDDFGKNDRGYYTYYKDEETDLNFLVAAMQVYYNNIKEMKDDYTEADVTYFEDEVRFKGVTLRGEGYSYKDWIILLLKYNGKKFRFAVLIKNFDSSIKYSYEEVKRTGIWNNVVKLIDEVYYLNF